MPSLFYIEVTLKPQTTVMHDLKKLYSERIRKGIPFFLTLPLTSVIKVLISLHGSLQYELMQCFEYLNLRDHYRSKWFALGKLNKKNVVIKCVFVCFSICSES